MQHAYVCVHVARGRVRRVEGLGAVGAAYKDERDYSSNWARTYPEFALCPAALVMPSTRPITRACDSARARAGQSGPSSCSTREG